MKLILTLLLLLFGFLNIKAQGYLSDLSGAPITERSKDEIGGSPYWFEKFFSAELKFLNGDISKIKEMNLDAITGNLVFINPKDRSLLIPDGDINSFNIENSNTVFEKVGLDDKFVFMQLLSSGSIKLYKHLKKITKEVVEYNSPSKSYRLANTTKYYIHDTNNQVIELKTDKKSIKDRYGDRAIKIIVDNKLNLKDEKQLIDFFMLLSK